MFLLLLLRLFLFLFLLLYGLVYLDSLLVQCHFLLLVLGWGHYCLAFFLLEIDVICLFHFLLSSFIHVGLPLFLLLPFLITFLIITFLITFLLPADGCVTGFVSPGEPSLLVEARDVVFKAFECTSQIWEI